MSHFCCPHTVERLHNFFDDIHILATLLLAIFEAINLHNIIIVHNSIKERREREWEELCKFNIFNCYESFSIYVCVYLICLAIEMARSSRSVSRATNEKEQIKAFLERQLYSMYNLYAD